MDSQHRLTQYKTNIDDWTGDMLLLLKACALILYYVDNKFAAVWGPDRFKI